MNTIDYNFIRVTVFFEFSDFYSTSTQYLSYCWEQAYSYSASGLGCSSTRVQRGLGISHTPLTCFADVRRFPQDVVLHLFFFYISKNLIVRDRDQTHGYFY